MFRIRILLGAALALPGCAAAPNADDIVGDDAGAPRDLAVAAATDLARADLARAPDLAPGKPPAPIGPSGGTVDYLRFAFHGDTRPMNCNDTANYPTAIIDGIYQKEAARNVQFAVDLGDHMFACSPDNVTSAPAQMKLYMNATKLLPAITFMTMGNHECTNSQSYCYLNSTQANYKAFMSALAPVSAKPYYSFDVATNLGVATFVLIADNAWDATEQQWLQATLAAADANAKYTIVARHHPIDNTDLATLATEWQIIQQHKYTLFLTGHTHEYKHDTWLDHSGRTVRMGAGGAPLDGNFYAYGVVQQQMDGKLLVTAYDAMTDNPQDSFTVNPQ